METPLRGRPAALPRASELCGANPASAPTAMPACGWPAVNDMPLPSYQSWPSSKSNLALAAAGLYEGCGEPEDDLLATLHRCQCASTQTPRAPSVRLFLRNILRLLLYFFLLFFVIFLWGSAMQIKNGVLIGFFPGCEWVLKEPSRKQCLAMVGGWHAPHNAAFLRSMFTPTGTAPQPHGYTMCWLIYVRCIILHSQSSYVASSSWPC
jgi:hypothetical protein